MVVDEGWRPGLIETLTGSPFGFQMVGPLPLFDPAGWDPDTGLDQALALLGWQSDRETFTSMEEALERLTALCKNGPVFVGPLEMGLLLHQPGSDRPIGADHFVAVLAAGSEGVTMHDPQGHPYAWLPKDAFMAAWGSDTIGYGTGRFPLRTNFRRVASRDQSDAVRDVLPLAHRWAAETTPEGTAASTTCGPSLTVPRRVSGCRPFRCCRTSHSVLGPAGAWTPRRSSPRGRSRRRPGPSGSCTRAGAVRGGSRGRRRPCGDLPAGRWSPGGTGGRPRPSRLTGPTSRTHLCGVGLANLCAITVATQRTAPDAEASCHRPTSAPSVVTRARSAKGTGLTSRAGATRRGVDARLRSSRQRR